jgi:hypothetical protein
MKWLDITFDGSPFWCILRFKEFGLDTEVGGVFRRVAELEVETSLGDVSFALRRARGSIVGISTTVDPFESKD